LATPAAYAWQLRLDEAEAILLDNRPPCDPDCQYVRLRVTVTNAGGAAADVNDNLFALLADGEVAYADGYLADEVTLRTGERGFGVVEGADPPLEAGATRTHLALFRVPNGAQRLTLICLADPLRLQKDPLDLRSALAPPLDVTGPLRAALSAPAHDLGARPAILPGTEAFRATVAPQIKRQGERIVVEGHGFTVPPVMRSGQGVALISIGVQRPDVTDAHTFTQIGAFNGQRTAPDGSFSLDVSTAMLPPGAYVIVVLDWTSRSVVYRGPDLLVSAP